MQTTLLQKTAHSLYVFGIFLLAASMPWSKFLMSNAQIILLAAWLMDTSLLEKLKGFIKNKTALVLSSIFILHVIGLLYSSDMNYGVEDVRKKIPLMLLPLIFSTSAPLSKQMLERILSLFVISVVVASFACFVALLGYTKKEILEPRDASIFISHIRFGLMISFAVFISGHFIYLYKNILARTLCAGTILWLILFLIMMEAATGLICITVVSILLAIYLIFKTKKILVKLFFIVTSLAVLFSGIYFILKNQNEDSVKSYSYNISLPFASQAGNIYLNDTLNPETENGNRVWIRICEKELEEEWNKKSKLKYFGKDHAGNEIKYTLIRFITSKGLNKDSVGINTLTAEEIKAIEKGVANVNYMSVFNPAARVQKIKWEIENYVRGGNPSGHSVTQRIEFWKAAVGIIKENLLFGVGTGDSKIAFELQYEKMNSKLTKEWRFRSHNQFLAVMVSLGILGLIIFLLSLIYPAVKEKNIFNYLYFTFFVISILSFLTEDTLETQAGITFFSFFNSLLLFCQKKIDRTGF